MRPHNQVLVLAAFAVALGVACGKPRPVEAVVPPMLTAVAPPPQSIEYTRISLAGPLPLPDTRLRETWAGPALSDARVVYDVTTEDLTDPSLPRRVEGVRVYYDRTGFGFLGTFDEDGAFQAWDPPQQVLPAHPRIGDAWEGTHQKGEASSARSCEILASDYCEGGMVAVCDSRRSGGTVVLRDHFCPGLGWTGFEALAQTGGGGPALRMWSENVVRNGEPIGFTFVESEDPPVEAPPSSLPLRDPPEGDTP